ncbi:uncharacterized protein LOC129290067 [Prosopis cineraria]|uniref:uncharacterized protein LOC129290067 n=1 Tax=Prosopis cineraria TaxID=364024 RepID=UPI00241021CA|nr:uncharacterized protein LOC129290067 [Prosopis cineraria]
MISNSEGCCISMVVDHAFHRQKINFLGKRLLAVNDYVNYRSTVAYPLLAGLTCKMASSSGEHILCFFHIRGHFQNDDQGSMQYVGGSVKTRTIKEGTTYEELTRMISSIIGNESNIIKLKFTINIDASTLVDLVDDDGVEHLIKYNKQSRHVYVVANGNDTIEASMDCPLENQQVIDNLLRVSDGCSFSLPSIYPEIEDLELACVVQMLTTPIPEMSSMKWKDLLVGKGQFFPNVDAFRQALYKYSISYKFSYKFKKNNKEKIIAYCKVEGYEWNIATYSMGKDNEILRVIKFNNDHTHNAQDNLIVSHPTRLKLTSSIMVDALRSNIDKGANELARDLYREYDVRLSYSQAYRGREKALREIHGRAEDSYSIIPWICDRLMETDPMTVAK